MPTPAAGARGTGNVLADILELDMADSVLELEPSAAPLTVFTKKLSKKRAINPEFNWLEDELAPRFDAIDEAAGYTDSDTVLTVDNGAYFQAQDMVYVTRTGEVVRVASVSGDDVTVVRGVGSTAAALVDNDELLVIGSSAEEGDVSKDAVSHEPVKVTNYCQIFRTPFEMTETMRHTSNEVSPHDWARQANKAGIEHMKDLEYSFLFGTPSSVAGSSHPRRTTGGFYHFATQNETAAGGALTESEFFTGLRSAFRYGSGTKLALASRLATDVLNSYPRGKLEVQQSEKTFGVRVMRYISPHGDLNVVTHNLLEGSVFGGHIAILDMDQLTYRFLAGENGSRDTKVLTNRQANDEDTRKDEYLTESGLMFGHARTHATITGITS